MELFRAAPHRWGDGKIHIIRPEDPWTRKREKTQCGRVLSETDGKITGVGTLDQVTCRGCVTSHRIREEAAQERHQREREREDWQEWYRGYLQSGEWQDLRERVFNRDNWICQGCLDAPAEETHHLTYERVGNEMLFDLISVCSNCHRQIHHQTEYDKIMAMAQGIAP
jgi:5-methylcytosine-specific restriction endonuclease McrA